MPSSTAVQLRDLLETLLQSPLPVRLRAWDGSETGPSGTPTLIVRNRRALRRVIWRPDELGLARAYVSGDLDVAGDLYDALSLLTALIFRGADVQGLPKRAVATRLLRLGVLGPQPKPPPEEIAMRGSRHTRHRASQAISHHYDVGNDFYRHLLGPSMVYSCAYWVRPDDPTYTLEDAQRDKCELICRKLGLRPGDRMLDVGCGWGSLVIHAAREYGVHAVGITLSHQQAELARKRVAAAGLTELVEIRVQDYREVADEPYDAISSIGMAEHVGNVQYAEYAANLFKLLRPGGRLLNHQITRRPGPANPNERTFIQAYVFPDGELLPVGGVVSRLEEAGFEVRDDESLREHYARTLRQWAANLDAAWQECSELTTVGRARVWKLYITGSAMSFDDGSLNIHQVLAVRPGARGESGLPPTRDSWLGVN